jgi:Protein of unknown function (DUF1579)
MKNIPHVAWVLFVLCGMADIVPAAHAQHASPSLAPVSSVPALIEQMQGTWDVQERMWTGSGAAAIDLPAAVAHRRLIGHAFLEEVMERAPQAQGDTFTRVSYFNYNAINQQYEYFSIDTRAPQMMFERTYAAGTLNNEIGITLYGGSFVAPRWGKATNVAFRYRIKIGGVQQKRQIVQLYLTPLSAEGTKEFLAFEYVYTRRQ